MGKLKRSIFRHCIVSLAQVILGSKNTIYIIGFLKFFQCLHSDLSGIKARAIKLRSPRLLTRVPRASAISCVCLTHNEGAIRRQPLVWGLLSLRVDLSKKAWMKLCGEEGTNLEKGDQNN